MELDEFHKRGALWSESLVYIVASLYPVVTRDELVHLLEGRRVN